MNILNKIEEFQLFCLENYRAEMKITGKQALFEFKKFEVFEFLESGYEVLHTQGMKYIISEIKEFINSRK
jgi:hypothetical protein